jgi:predicted component of type VI protein secretion system
MDKQQILSVLEKLQTELSSVQEVDDDKQQKLQSIATDIQQLLTQEENPSSEQVDPVNASIQDLLLQFESEHPSLTAALNQVAAGLSNLGI